jgi:hypothetical protein
MLNLRELEKNYLICLMQGGDIQDVTLSESMEKIHAEVRRLRNKGFVVIPPGIIPETLTWSFRNDDWRLASKYAEEIREIQTRLAIKKSAKDVNLNLPSDIIISSLREELDALAEKTGKNAVISTAELQKTKYENTEFIVERLLPVGLTLLIGPPKMGKSWLLLYWSICISMGFPVFKNQSK